MIQTKMNPLNHKAFVSSIANSHLSHVYCARIKHKFEKHRELAFGYVALSHDYTHFVIVVVSFVSFCRWYSCISISGVNGMYRTLIVMCVRRVLLWSLSEHHFLSSFVVFIFYYFQCLHKRTTKIIIFVGVALFFYYDIQVKAWIKRKIQYQLQRQKHKPNKTKTTRKTVHK